MEKGRGRVFQEAVSRHRCEKDPAVSERKFSQTGQKLSHKTKRNEKT